MTHGLPTEDQWEAAARGGLVSQPYPWGDAAPDAGGVFRANFRTALPRTAGFSFTAPVGSFPPNGYGLFDMAGNVSEWCQDRYVPLRTGGPFKPGVLRLLKGGSWINGPRDLRAAARQSASPQYADGYIGFRVVRLPHP
jgi:formylglycine-generating enzyme required for sulfatase activity